MSLTEPQYVLKRHEMFDLLVDRASKEVDLVINDKINNSEQRLAVMNFLLVRMKEDIDEYLRMIKFYLEDIESKVDPNDPNDLTIKIRDACLAYNAKTIEVYERAQKFAKEMIKQEGIQV